MDNMDIEKLKEELQKELKVLNCYESLSDAIRKAGGAVKLEKCGKMTIDDFIKEVAAPNGIFFYFKGATR